MDVKMWIETTGFKAKEIRFLKAPPYPYIVFIDEQLCRGSYGASMIVEHALSVELYTETIDQDAIFKLENLIDDLEVNYSKNTEWIETESHFKTTYDFMFIEKKRKKEIN